MVAPLLLVRASCAAGVAPRCVASAVVVFAMPLCVAFGMAGGLAVAPHDRHRVGVVGGLRRECMYEGREAIDREMNKARALIRKGRFIPGPDHMVLRDATFESYRYFIEQLRQVVMTTEPEV